MVLRKNSSNARKNENLIDRRSGEQGLKDVPGIEPSSPNSHRRALGTTSVLARGTRNWYYRTCRKY